MHLCGEALLHVVTPARQKRVSLLDQRRVVLAGDVTDAGRAATLDLIQQARPRARRKNAVAARPQQKRLLQGHKGSVDRPGRSERTEIAALLGSRAAELGELRKIVIGREMDERKRLVVPQQHIVARHQPLDQVALEQQCFRLGVRHHDVHRGSLGDHSAQPVRQPGGMRVVLHAALEVARLADIERVTSAVEHAIDTRAGRHASKRLADRSDTAGDARYACMARSEIGRCGLARQDAFRRCGGPLGDAARGPAQVGQGQRAAAWNAPPRPDRRPEFRQFIVSRFRHSFVNQLS